MNENQGHSQARAMFTAERCGRCGSVRNPQIHHIDRNPTNNDPSNIEILCAKCHRREHAKEGHRITNEKVSFDLDADTHRMVCDWRKRSDGAIALTWLINHAIRNYFSSADYQKRMESFDAFLKPPTPTA